jgi:hypothetical protein
MSYSVIAYAIDLTLLQNVCGSGDMTIMTAIEERFREDIARLNEQYAEDITDALPIEAVLHALITGVFPWAYDDAPYLDGLQLLCQYYGTVLPNDAFSELRPLGVKFIEEEAPPIQRLVFQSSSPIPIPGSEVETMYRVGSLGLNELCVLLQERVMPSDALTAVSTDADEDDLWKRYVYAQFYGWLEQAVQLQRGIVTFFV